MIDVAANQRVGDGIEWHFEAANHERFNDRLCRFRKTCAAERFYRGHPCIKLPVLERIRKRSDRFGHAHRAERKHRSPPRPSMSAGHFFDGEIDQPAERKNSCNPGRSLSVAAADFLYDNRLHDFALHRILSPRLGRNAAPLRFRATGCES